MITPLSLAKVELSWLRNESNFQSSLIKNQDVDPRSNKNFRTSLKEGVIYAFKIARFNVILLSFSSEI